MTQQKKQTFLNISVAFILTVTLTINIETVNSEFTLTGMSTNPANPPKSQLNIDGTWERCTAQNCDKSLLGGAYLDSDGYYRYAVGGHTRYVFQNENHYKMALNIDGVMNFYGSNTNIDGSQGGRIGYIYGAGQGKMATYFNGKNRQCNTCILTETNGVNVFEDLAPPAIENQYVGSVKKYAKTTNCVCPSNYYLSNTLAGSVCILKSEYQCRPFGGVCDPDGDCVCPYRGNSYSSNLKRCSGINSNNIKAFPNPIKIKPQAPICTNTPMYIYPTKCKCPSQHLYLNNNRNKNIYCEAVKCPNDGLSCDVSIQKCYCKYDCQGLLRGSQCVGDPANGCGISIDDGRRTQVRCSLN